LFYVKYKTVYAICNIQPLYLSLKLAFVLLANLKSTNTLAYNASVSIKQKDLLGLFCVLCREINIIFEVKTLFHQNMILKLKA
jgi:hypothetical protein